MIRRVVASTGVISTVAGGGPQGHFGDGGAGTGAELRQPYDRLVLKVVALVQDGDPPLAGAIVASREAIWSILADPTKFASQ